MQTVTVKLDKTYQDMFQRLKRNCKDNWKTSASTSEVIRYAIWVAYKQDCSEKNSLTNST